MFFFNMIILGLAAVAAAHPGREASEYRHAVAARANTQANKRALEGCKSQLESHGVSARNIERRRSTLEKHRQARNIPIDGELCRNSDELLLYTMPLADTLTTKAAISKRSTISVLNTDHEGDIDATAAEADETIAFNSTSCTVLNPEGEVGPFYVLGEYVRADVVDDEPGVSLVADIQFIDVSTCEPLVGVCKCLVAFIYIFHVVSSR